MKVRKKIQRLIDRAPRGELRAFELMPDTWRFAADELADLHPSSFLRLLHGALLVRQADNATGWAAIRLGVDWDPGIEHLRFGVEGLVRGVMVQIVDRLCELDGYEGLKFASPDDEGKMARVIDVLTGAPVRQRLKFESGGPIEEARRAIDRWLRRWRTPDVTLVLRGSGGNFSR